MNRRHRFKINPFHRSIKKPGFVFFLMGLVAGYYSFEVIHPQWQSSREPSKIYVCFTPGGQCTDLIIREINKATKIIRMQTYSFTSKPIAQSLIEAQKRGVDVKILVDKSQRTDPHSVFHFLKRHGISVIIDRVSGIAHNKVILIDNKSVITGSFNFTNDAQKRNAENVVLINDSKTAEYYMENWRNREKI